MSSTKSTIGDISGRVVELSSIYPSAKAFLEECGISNYSLITDLKKGRIKNPGSDILAQIVRKTGCNGNWLLIGKGEMFPEEQNNILRETDLHNPVKIRKLEMSVDSILKEGLDNEYIPTGLDLKLAKTLTLIIESKQP